MREHSDQTRPTWTRPDLLAALAVAIGIGLLPVVIGQRVTSVAIGLTVIALFAYSFNITGGMLGELNLAHVVSWGIGGYGTIYLLQSGWPLLMVVVAVAIMGTAFMAALLFVTHVLKLDGLYFAVFSLVVAEIAIALARHSDALGANEGIRMPIPARLPISTYHWVGIALLLLFILLTQWILRSPRGLRWLGTRDDADGARAVGIPVLHERLIAYSLSGGLAALGGAFHGHSLGFAAPDVSLSIGMLVIGVLAVFSGGPGTVLGPIVGTILIQGLASVANYVATGPQVAIGARFAQYVLAYLIIRTLVSRFGGDDVVSGLLRRRNRHSKLARDGRPEPQEQTAAPLPVATTPVANTSQELALEAIDVHKAYGGNTVLRGVDFSLRAGEFVALVGPNGAGKTTLTNILTGFEPPNAGSVRLLGTSVNGLSTDRRFRLGLARTFQTPRLFPRLTLLENVAIACSAQQDQAAAVLRQLEVDDMDRKAEEATLFDHRMVEVARALASEASVILLDEPLAGLSPHQRQIILGALVAEAQSGKAVLIIEHLIPTIAPVVNRMSVLHGGRIIADGAPDAVLQEPAVVESYLGQPLEPTS